MASASTTTTAAINLLVVVIVSTAAVALLPNVSGQASTGGSPGSPPLSTYPLQGTGPCNLDGNPDFPGNFFPSGGPPYVAFGAVCIQYCTGTTMPGNPGFCGPPGLIDDTNPSSGCSSPGNQFCSCMDGYYPNTNSNPGLNGQCLQYNECTSSGGPAACPNTQICTDSDPAVSSGVKWICNCNTGQGLAPGSAPNGAATCSCASGYLESPSQVCLVDPCANPGRCPPGTTCSSFYSQQDNAFDYTCDPINECASNPCLYGSTCVDGDNAFSCESPMAGFPCQIQNCRAGYSDNGTNCV